MIPGIGDVAQLYQNQLSPTQLFHAGSGMPNYDIGHAWCCRKSY